MITTNGKVTYSNNGVAAVESGFHSPASPTRGLPRVLWNAWREYGHRIATYQTELLLSLVYFLVLGPSGWFAGLSGKRLIGLGIVPKASSYWIRRKAPDTSMLGMQRQF